MGERWMIMQRRQDLRQLGWAELARSTGAVAVFRESFHPENGSHREDRSD